MAPATGGEPGGELLARLQRRFGSWEDFREDFKKGRPLGVRLRLRLAGGRPQGLRIVTTPNQNSPIAWGLEPILTIDVWEHAYYLKHYNLRADYIDDWFALVDWEQAQERAAR